MREGRASAAGTDMKPCAATPESIEGRTTRAPITNLAMMKRLPHLCQLPTPLWPLRHVPGLAEEVPLYIKREDMSAPCELAGNKARKLSFTLGEALEVGADVVLTFGTTDSSSCRAVAVACATIGLPSHLVLLHLEDGTAPPSNNNRALMELVGADVTILTVKEYRERGGIASINEILRSVAETLMTVKGYTKPFIIPMGGSNGIGARAGMEVAEEIRRQVMKGEYQEVFAAGKALRVITAIGSGSTFAGLAAAVYAMEKAGELGEGSHVVGYAVHGTLEHHQSCVKRILRDCGYAEPEAAAILKQNSIRDAGGLGYGKPSEEELGFLTSVARATGVVLDPTYTNKAMFQFVNDCRTGQLEPSVLSVFVHTGGLLGLLDKQSLLRKVE